MTEPRSLDSDFVAEHGIATRHEVMPSGELRFRLMGDDGNGYIRTETGKGGAWQNSHSHHRVHETYIVESGWMVIAELNASTQELILKRYGPSEIVTLPPERAHNVYLPARTTVHTVKHGSASGEPDWVPAPDLDSKTKPLSEPEIFDLLQPKS